MELQKLVSDILNGELRVLPFDNVAIGPEKVSTVCALSALNFARIAFAVEGNTPILSRILTSLCSRKMVESVLAVCREWHSDVSLEVEEVYQIPLFEVSLKLVSTNYNPTTINHITRLLERLRTFSSSAAILISRHPDVITCLRLQTMGQEVFVLFNPWVASGDKRIATLTFATSLPQIAQQIYDVFSGDDIHLTEGNLDRQTRTLDNCTRHVFIPKATYDPSNAEDCLLVSSLRLLTLKAELDELTHSNDYLKEEKQRLKGNIIDLGAQLERERAKSKETWSSKSSAAKTKTQSTPYYWGSQFTRSFYPTREPEAFVETEDEMDPSIQYALQLQASFDSENESLLKQKRELMLTAQRQYHCGICLDDFPEDDAVRIDMCRHEICRDCVRGHVWAKIEEHRFPVLCPVCTADAKNKNPGTIPGTIVQLLGVSEKQWETWVEMELAQFSIPFTCPKCRHSAFVDRQDLDDSPEIHCPFPACDHVWCKKCQQGIDPNGAKHSCDGTSELDHLMKQQGWRYCPNCKTPIQKTQGCNHLSCIAPGCNTHFCYRCGGTINRTAIPREIQEGKTAHFRNCTLF